MKLLVSALEPSANLHLEPLLRYLPGVEICGIFDRRFGATLYEGQEFAVMGIVDALKKVPLARRAISQMVELAKGCDRVLLIDGPGFNIPLARALKNHYPNKDIFYYILPKVWAWKKGRIAQVEAITTAQLLIFPFERLFWKQGEYVGNPLLDEIPSFREAVVAEGPVAFLPGSRAGEITRLMPVFREVAAKIEGAKEIVIPAFFDDATIATLYGDLSGFTIVRNTYEALERARFAFVCSGTATLEAALMGVPMVLVYKARPLDYWIGRRVVKLAHVGLANIIADFAGEAPVHEELLQDEVNVQRLLESYHHADAAAFLAKSHRLRELLEHGSAERVARRIMRG
ncbi:MAG: lipid-A-disaccharide synthase [Campylobacterales bacterium]